MGRGGRGAVAPLGTLVAPAAPVRAAVLIGGDPTSWSAEPLLFELPENAVRVEESDPTLRSAVELATGDPLRARIVPGPGGRPYLVDDDHCSLPLHDLVRAPCPQCTRDDCPHTAAAHALVLEHVPAVIPENARWSTRALAGCSGLRAPQGDARIFSVRFAGTRSWHLVELPGLPREVITVAGSYCSVDCARSDTPRCLHRALGRGLGIPVPQSLDLLWREGRARIDDSSYPPRLAHPDEPRLYLEAWSALAGETYIDVRYRTGSGPLESLVLDTRPVDRRSTRLAHALAALVPPRPSGPQALREEDPEPHHFATVGDEARNGWRAHLYHGAPVQGGGDIDGLPMSYRARYTEWEVRVAARPGDDPRAVGPLRRGEGFYFTGCYGTKFEAGSIPLEHAWRQLDLIAEEVRRRSARV